MRTTKELVQAARDIVPQEGEALIRRGREEDCCCPNNITYVIFCNCVTINNGACEDWEFCQAGSCVAGNPISQG